MADQSRVGSIRLGHWLPHDDLLGWDAPLHDFVHRSPREHRTGLHEQLLVRIVFGVALVVELHVIEIDCVPHALVHCHICPILVEILLEVWSLRGVSDQVVGEQSAEFPLELYQPLLALAILHRRVIFPVDVDPVQIVPTYKAGQFGRAVNGVHSACGWEFSGSECTDEDLHPIIIVFFLQIFLNLVLGVSEH